jgi:hypothetical protein
MRDCEILEEMGYTGCRLLGANYPCFDVEGVDPATGIKVFVAVETRNHTTCTGAIKNNDYNVLANPKQVQMAEDILRRENAIGLYAAVTVHAPRQRYDVRMGLIDDLLDKRYIPMSAKARSNRENLIARDTFDPRIKPEWSNVR